MFFENKLIYQQLRSLGLPCKTSCEVIILKKKKKIQLGMVLTQF